MLYLVVVVGDHDYDHLESHHPLQRMIGKLCSDQNLKSENTKKNSEKRDFKNTFVYLY